MSNDGPEYRSPKRCLAHSFRLSRDRWKEKATQRKDALRALRGRARDLAVSRDLWKRKALHYAELLRAAGRLPAEAHGPAPAAPSPPAPPAPSGHAPQKKSRRV